MNAVEIEQAITNLAEQPFGLAEFPYAFLEAFGNKATTIKRLRAGASNKSDLGGVLQTNNIHILTCDVGRVTQTLAALKASPATAKAKAKFILATDGADFEAEDLTSGETVACAFKDFPDHFGFFLPLAGISTVRQISENAFDIRATSRLNRLYVELLKENPEWGTAERRHDMTAEPGPVTCDDPNKKGPFFVRVITRNRSRLSGLGPPDLTNLGLDPRYPKQFTSAARFDPCP